MYEICEARTMRICPAIGDETLCEVLWVSYLEFIPKSSMKLKDIKTKWGGLHPKFSVSLCHRM